MITIKTGLHITHHVFGQLHEMIQNRDSGKNSSKIVSSPLNVLVLYGYTARNTAASFFYH